MLAVVRVGSLVVAGALLTSLAVWRWSATHAAPEPVGSLDDIADGVVAVWNRVLGPPAPAAAPAPRPPARTGPCVDRDGLALGAIDTDPVVCSKRTCMRLVEGGLVVVAPEPTMTSALPLARDAEGHFGPQLRAAIAAENDPPSATLDLRTVVVGGQPWSVARDRLVELVPPEFRPNGPEREVAVAGDLLLVQWEGSCTDGLCLVSQLVDRDGHERGWVQSHGAVLRLDARDLIAISELSTIEVRDLHTGTQRGRLELATNESDFIAAVRLDDQHLAMLRSTDDGVVVQVVEVRHGRPTLDKREWPLPDCE